MLKLIHSKMLFIATSTIALLALGVIPNTYAAAKCDYFQDAMDDCMHSCTYVTKLRSESCRNHCEYRLIHSATADYAPPEDFVGPPDLKRVGGDCGQN